MSRGFVHGITDCYSLIRDWYILNKDVQLPNTPRNWKWWLGDEDFYEDGFAKNGFKIVPTEEIMRNGPQIGDGFLIKLRSKKINHAGIYVGDGKGLHHVATYKPVDLSRVPIKEPLEPWVKHIHLWVRRYDA